MKNHAYFQDPDLESNELKNKIIIRDSINKTMACYFQGELDENSVHEDYRISGTNHI